MNIKDEKTLRIGAGVGTEFAGQGDPDHVPGSNSPVSIGANLNANINVSNYRGVSVDLSLGGGINVLHCVSAGVNIGVGSQSGASIDYDATLTLGASQILSKDMSAGLGVNVTAGSGYSTRSGVRELNFSGGVSERVNRASVNFGSSYCLIGLRNYVPVITNSSTMETISGRIKLGGEFFTAYGYGYVSGQLSTLHYNNNATRASFGYMYLQDAPLDGKSILDFTRDKDGMFNKTMSFLPPPAMTYDVYSVSGQGTGGVFRPFRNDFGSVYDPFTEDTSITNGIALEVGLGDAFESGADGTTSRTHIVSGPWDDYNRSVKIGKRYTSNSLGHLYENVYFKQAGELTEADSSYSAAIVGCIPITPRIAMGFPQTKPGSDTRRDVRANLFHYYTAEEDTTKGIGSNPDIISYNRNTFSGYSTPATEKIKRIGKGDFQRKKHQISEIVQVQKDGRKYVYGIPVLKNVQREVRFSVDKKIIGDGTDVIDLNSGTVEFTAPDASAGNRRGRDNYYNSTVTPSCAHSFLLTSVLSTDYVDLTGNGPSDDDLGSFTKFNYTRMDSDYRWVAPYSGGLNKAQYNPGFWSDPLDDKGSFVCGSREQWNLRSIETKNFIAEFYTSERDDAKGIMAAILNNREGSIFNALKPNPSFSYKLDSIKLYNKHDRFITGSKAIPIKTVYFLYNYDICPGTINSTRGKLELKRIYFSYGTSQKSMVSPYQFEYGYNPRYDVASKDRWGSYKPNHAAFTNYEYPYVDQNDTANNTYASAWSLIGITLPSGGVIQAQYECNDYAFVQDKPANEMFMVKGLGNSKSFKTTPELYYDGSNPNLYAYFARRQPSENPMLSFAQNYFGKDIRPDGDNCIYFNFNVALTNEQKTAEQIKGYANIVDIGICPHDSAYGYIKFKAVTARGGGATLNPVTYTTLNVGRYNLPQVIFPGANPDETDMNNILAGLKDAFQGLINVARNPLVQLVEKSDAKHVNLAKSFIRLQSVGLKKKGGGQRVKALYFQDQWKTLAGGNELNATYGKVYNYTTQDPTYGTISSGVASYEPAIGGDENPMRQPVKYIAQEGSVWPPTDPVDLYQETPIGESLFPPAQIGYSEVKVTSIHADIGKSAQGIDKYLFYTSKDFPAQVLSTSIESKADNDYDFFGQNNSMTAMQGYTLIFNDMHGKPKKVEHSVFNPRSDSTQVVSYQIYNYRTKGNKLDNNVNCLVFDGSNMKVKQKQLGVEEDVTLDCRRKSERTTSSTTNANLNVFIIPLPLPIPVPVPFSFTWSGDHKNEFQSAVVTKVVQQYGILDNIQSFDEGATTTMRNELYDPNTGQAVVTSITNEYKDKEYTTSIPAYWAYKGMGLSCQNIGYTDAGTITIASNGIGALNTSNTSPFTAGDQLAVSFTDASHVKHNIEAWVLGIVPQYHDSSFTVYIPNVRYDTSYTIFTDYTRHCYSYGVLDGRIRWDSLNNRDSDLVGGIWRYREINTEGKMQFSDTCIDSSIHSFTRTVTLDTFECKYLRYPYATSGADNVFDTVLYNLTTSVAEFDYKNVIEVTLGYHRFDTIIANSIFGNILINGIVCEFFTYVNFNPSVDTTWHYTPVDTTYDTVVRDTALPICTGLNVLPRYPLNTPGWVAGTTLTGVTVKVVNSGQKNMLTDNVETYTSMNYPVNSSGQLNTSLTGVINLKARTFADSITVMLHNFITNADSTNPFAIGQRGIWRLFSEYGYLTSRNYTSTTARNSGLFNANSMFASVSGLPGACFQSPYNYFMPSLSDPNWHRTHTVTKYSPYGKEIENIDAVGNYSTAVFGYNNELPVAVAYNARQGQVLADGFEDYNLLQSTGNIMNYIYSPFNTFGSNPLSSLYRLLNLSGSSSVPGIALNIAHTGHHSLLLPAGGTTYDLRLPVSSNVYAGVANKYNLYYPIDSTHPYVFTARNEYLPFSIYASQKYILSFWIRQSGSVININDYTLPSTSGVLAGGTDTAKLTKRSGVIDGWQQVEATFTVSDTSHNIDIVLPSGYYIDDIRIYPASANMKAYVYHSFNEKLMATLDDNNFATMYEYDQEGNLVRVKKETSKGIMTVSESRSGNPKP